MGRIPELASVVEQLRRIITQPGVTAREIKKVCRQVRDIARIDEVIALIKQEAKIANYPEDMAEAIWKNIIELSINYEYDAYDKKG